MEVYEVRDHRYWDRFWSEHNPRYNERHQKIWRVLEDFIGDGLWIDLGIGPATFWMKYPKPFVGADFSFVALQRAITNAPKGIYVRTDARSTPFPDNQFDGVLLSGLMDYFDDWTPVLKEAERIGKPGVPIVFTLYAGEHHWDQREIRERVALRKYSEVGPWRICVV